MFVPAARPEPPSVAGVVVIGTESALTVAGTEMTPPPGAVASLVIVMFAVDVFPATSVAVRVDVDENVAAVDDQP